MDCLPVGRQASSPAAPRNDTANDMLKKFSSFFIRFGLSFILLAYLFSKIDRQKTLEVIRSADAAFLFWAFMVFLVNNALLLLRWRIMMRGLKLKVPLLQAARSHLIGLFGNLFLPSSIGGDILKALTLCKQSQQRTKVVASILLDRLNGFSGIVTVALVSFAAGYRMIGDPGLILPVVILGGVSALGAFVLFNRRAYETVCGIVNAFPKFKAKLIMMHDDVVLLKRNPQYGFMAFAAALGTQLLFICAFYLIARALGQDVALGYFFVFVPLICVASFIPSIGGLGVREAGAVFLFSRIGVASEAAVSMSLMTFLFMLIIGLTGGLVYVATLYSRRVQCPSQNPVS